MAVTANQVLIRRASASTQITSGKAAAVNLYAGTFAFYDASTGYITNDDNSGANAFAGVVYQQCDNSGGSAGDLSAELITQGQVLVTGSGFSQATVGDAIYASDNYTATTSSTSTSLIGRCTDFVSSTQVYVNIQTDV